VQTGRDLRPGKQVNVLARGPGGEHELPDEEAVFGGLARSESGKSTGNGIIHAVLTATEGPFVTTPRMAHSAEVPGDIAETNGQDLRAGGAAQKLYFVVRRPALGHGARCAPSAVQLTFRSLVMRPVCTHSAT
jgi:hypothetical protein